MLYCEVMGGLGNQLFQIFTTIAYSLKYNRPFTFLDVEKVGKRHTYWNSLLNSLKKYTVKNRPVEFNVITEKGFEYNELSIPQDPVVMLHGYFQSEKYFKESYGKIYKLCGLDNQKITLESEYPKMYSTTVSMHFRLGDYKKLPNHYPILPFEYYKNALNYIKNVDKKTNISDVLVFCEKEDRSIVEAHIINLRTVFPTYTFSFVEDTISDWKQMIMMSLCKYNILANSSFSWWGAYLNTNQQKLVVYPDIWFGTALKHHNTKDLCPLEWTKISSLPDMGSIDSEKKESDTKLSSLWWIYG